MMLSGKRVFISGGAGVIGRILVWKLYEAGCTVFVGDLKPRPSDWGEDIRYRQGDLNYITQAEIDDFSPELFFHLAATFERSTETYGFWDENYEHNLKLSHHLMTLMKECASLKQVVFTSSYLIYDPQLYNFSVPLDKAVRLKETDPIRPRNMCGAAKLLHEVELEFLTHYKPNGLQTVCARIFRVYGKGSKDVISRWVRMLLKGEAITVYKKEGLFDYIYADEVAAGLIRLAERQLVGIVNLGNDNARRVADVVEVLRRHFPDMKLTEGDLDIPYEGSQANMDLFRARTGWTPAMQLEDAIPEIIAFEKAAAQQQHGMRQQLQGRGNHVLVTSISKKVPLLQAVKQAVRKLGDDRKVIGADADDSCLGKHFVDEFCTLPYLSQLPVAELIDICNNRGISCIIPTRDGELSYFAEHKHILQQHGIAVMVPDVEAVRHCLDKLAFYETLHALQYPVIPTALDIDQLEGNLFVVKERFGSGSTSMQVKLTRKAAQQYVQSLNDPIFQPYVQGTEVSVDVYVDRTGKTKGVVARTRDVVVGGESQITTTIRNAALEQMCSKLAEDIKLYGHAVMQIMIDESGGFHIIECNSRFGGASTLSLAAGLDSFYWFLLEAGGSRLGAYPFMRAASEKKMIRHAADFIV